MSTPSFSEIAAECAALVEQKNTAYGNAFDKCAGFLKLLYPDGIQPESYGDMLAMVRIFDKQMRIATDRDAFGEDPYRDILGYALLAVRRRQSE